MNGIVNVMKPAGMTSHDVVAKLRKIFQTRKVGHTGTLDPDAIGVLPICIGQATRLAEYLTEKEKTYKTILKFGHETTTQDASGQVTCTTSLPFLSREAFVALLMKSFVGEIQQIPPMYSAIKRNGQPLYKLARQGIEVDIAPRTITIHKLKVLMYCQESAMLEVTCSKGTYIRTLCQDIGRACGSSAYMSYLMRTASGSFTMETAVRLEQLAEAKDPSIYLISLNDALPEMPAIIVEQEINRLHILNGLSQKLSMAARLPEQTLCKAIDPDHQLLAIGVTEKGSFKPNKVFKCGE